jgi:cation transport ATPase
VLRIAASLDQASRHIIAQTIVEEARGKGLSLAVPSDVVETAGEGLIGRVESRQVMVGGLHFIAGKIGASVSELLGKERPPGALAAAVAADGKLIGVLILADELRAGTEQLLRGAARPWHRAHRVGDWRPA